jgi:hypothetical protein
MYNPVRAMQSQNPFVLLKLKLLLKINIGNSVLEGSKGIVQNIYEEMEAWVNIDPADLVSTLECVFKSYDAGVSRSVKLQMETQDGI